MFNSYVVSSPPAAASIDARSKQLQAEAPLSSGNGSPGCFGRFGGAYMPETLMPCLLALEQARKQAWEDASFWSELAGLVRSFAGGPSPLYFAERASAELGLKLWLKREDLKHTGSHKINNCLGQGLLARRMGKARVIAETGAGQHGVACAAVCAKLGLRCEVYMGSLDVQRQSSNVARMRLLGAQVHPVESGSRTLKDAMNEALRDWLARPEDTYYMLGTGSGPHPYPSMVRDLQRLIGEETRAACLSDHGGLPDYVLACVGGGSNSIGMFSPFLGDPGVKLIGVEAAGAGLDSGRHAACLSRGRPGVLHGTLSYLLQTEEGQVQAAHSVSAGLDYPSVGPEHAYLKESGRVQYEAATDQEVVV